MRRQGATNPELAQGTSIAAMGARSHRGRRAGGPDYSPAPYRLRTNRKAERFIQTLTNRWAYGAIYGSSAERTAALPGWLDHYNFRRGHGSLGHRPPAARLAELELPRE